MSRQRFALTACLMMLAVALSVAPAKALDEQASEYWNDFIHYSRVARLDLAASNGQALVDQGLEAEALLEVIEQSPYADSYPRDLVRMQNMSGEKLYGIKQVAVQVEEAINDAKIAVIRDPARIADEIDKLDQGLRARKIAVSRLVEAGEYAVPQLVEVVRADSARNKELRPYAIEALVQMNRPVVLPLSESLGSLPLDAQQDVARILGRIGYPLALPYLKEVAERPDTDDKTLAVLRESISRLVAKRGLSPETAASAFYLLLAEDYYAGRESLILEPTASHNLRWMVDDAGQLTYQRIPTEIYIDVMTMQATKRSLKLNPNGSDALSLWLASNFRRENRLPVGVIDPSYSSEMRSPQYYATLAGPAHVKPVLRRALTAGDYELALDAVDALSDTAGHDVVLYEGDSLINALNAPDRRVRYATAFTLAKAQPQTPFEGAGRVVPVLAEAVRQDVKPVVMVVAEDQTTINSLVSKVRGVGNFDVISSRGVGTSGDELMTVTGVDVVVIQGPASFINAFNVGRGSVYKIAASPLVVLAAPGELTAVNRLLAGEVNVAITRQDAGNIEITEAINQAFDSMRGGAIDAEAASDYALEALGLLREIAMGSRVYDAALAKPALILALGDRRDAVVLGAARVLSEVGGSDAQQAIAAAALNGDRSTQMKIRLLGLLSNCARKHGPSITEYQADQLLKLVNEARGPLADAASAAYGALNMPSAHSTRAILD